VSGNLNIAAVQVFNARNIQVGGTTAGVPVVQAPNIGALTVANNAAGSAANTDTPTSSTTTDRPSIILVEFLGFGDGDGSTPPVQDNDHSRKGNDQHSSYDPNSRLQIIGLGALTDAQKQQLIEAERKRLVGQ